MIARGMQALEFRRRLCPAPLGYNAPTALLHANLAGLREGAEIRTLRLDEGKRLGRRRDAGLCAQFADARGDGLFAQRLIDRAVQLLAEVVRRSLGRHEGLPGHPSARIEAEFSGQCRRERWQSAGMR